MLRRSTRLKLIIVGIISIVLIAGAGITYAIIGGDDMVKQDPTKEEKPSIVTTDTRPNIYTTEDGFTRYFQAVQNGDNIISKDNVHLVPTVDWNEQAIVSVPFDILASRTYQSVNLETIDGKKTIVVDVLDPPKNCMVTQENKSHIAFLAVDQADAKSTFSIVIRQNPNSAKCEN